ncbi:hypothetical protein IWW49_000412 [Coemansia sp. RSA 1797]|nr:hypothetical protein IWW49_000412 [Coemansia sp. RSA 1797]
MRIDMRDQLPTEAVSRQITNDTQFMFQFYKPCFQFYAPSPSIDSHMSPRRLQQSLTTALHSCPLLLGRFTVHADQTISHSYDPRNPNLPTFEFQSTDLTFSELKSQGFAYSLCQRHSMDLAIPDGAIRRLSDEQPMLMVKVTYLHGGGAAVFAMTNHVAFDGNAMFSFLAYWAQCNNGHGVELPVDLQPVSNAILTNVDQTSDISKDAAQSPAEISVDATRLPAEIGTMITRAVSRDTMIPCVYSITTQDLRKLKQQVEASGELQDGEWVSSNNVLTALISQCVARANMRAHVYEHGPWTVFQALDMRRPLGLPLRGLGSPIILAECNASADHVLRPDRLPALARRVRMSVDAYTPEYLRNAMQWMHTTYAGLARDGVDEPWRHFWFSALNTNRRCVGVSCMNRIPIYDADFGAGRPVMARSFNPRPNYVIVFPGPPGETDVYDSLHMYVTLERPAMDALRADPEWTSVCTLVSEF